MMRTTLISALMLLACATATAAEHRMELVAHHDWTAHRGFYLSLENTAPDPPLRPATLKLFLGVGDGERWRFLTASPDWKTGRDYAVRAVIGPASAELWLDGERLETSPGGFAPASVEVTACHITSWPPPETDYHVVVPRLRLSSGSGKPLEASFAPAASRPRAVYLFDPQRPTRYAWSPGGDTVTVEATFRLEPNPDPRELSPFIDRYGQSIHARWNDKVRADDDLRAAASAETARTAGWKRPPDWDAFGGDRSAGWKEEATGFYRTVRRDGMWWLVSPEGHPLFYTGLCTADVAPFEKTPVSDREHLFAELPPKTGNYAPAWARDVWLYNDDADYVSFYTANLVRKHGSGWQAAAERSIRDRLARWGFSGQGKWGESFDGVASVPVLFHGEVPNLSRHPDIFDTAVQATFREALRRQIAPRRDDPYVLGWSVGNEYSEIVLASEVTDVLAKGAAVPAKRALIDHGVDTLYDGDPAKAAVTWGVTGTTREALYAAVPALPDADREALRRFYADRYYAFIFRTIKEIDPNHLYFGFWIVPDWWENEEDWRLIARHCDVIGYDRYARTFSDPQLDRLIRETAKPVLCGEFSFPPFYGGVRGNGVYQVWSDDDDEAGRLYGRWLDDAARNPYCVGVFYFQYRDQPITGRGPGRSSRLVIEEHYAFGLVDITDRPKWDLVSAVRAANLDATDDRLKAAAPSGSKR